MTGTECERIIAILESLKEQIIELKREAVSPKRYPETRYSGELMACGRCGHEIEGRQQRFCPFCGRVVKWE